MRGLVLAFLFVALWFAYVQVAPDRYDVTAPLDLTEPPNPVSDLKLSNLSTESCFARLGEAGVEVTRLPDAVKAPGCVWDGVATLGRSTISWGGGVTLRCPMIAKLYQWERFTVAPAAERYLGQRVVRLRHYGTYACRNVNNAATGRRSQHARANAVDVAGFVLEDGSEVTLLRHWEEGGPEALFLRAVRDGACDRFNTVLGPDYNALHRDHFHFADGPFAACR